MRKCIVIHKGKEYSMEEFRDLVLAEGLGGVFDGSTDLANKIMAKYDFLNQEDSLMEMWAKLEVRKLNNKGESIEYTGTESQIVGLIQPKGQLTDYATQEQIRYNTYSGISLTGISANFGKVMGYVFETTPIESVRDKDTGNIITTKSEAAQKLLKEFEVSSLEELVKKSTRYAVASREVPMLNSQYWFSINGQTIDRFRREELLLLPKQKPANIFEAIDTIINLAIDNVKEQKLHVLGITNASANSFLNMVGLGVPLPVVSKIFRTPGVVALNDMGRYTKENLTARLVDSSESFLREQDASTVKAQGDQYGINVTVVDGVITSIKGSVSTELLDKIYAEEATPIEKALSDYMVGKALVKLVPLNETMFEYAQIFSLLRGFPNKKWKADSIANKIERYASFSDIDTKNAGRLVEYESAVKDNFKNNSPTYELILKEQGEEAAEEYLKKELEAVKESPSFYGELERALRANKISTLLRSGRNNTFSGGDNTPIKNSSPLNLPHVFEAYVSLLQFRNIVERVFAVHSPTVQAFTAKILDSAAIFSPFDAMEKADTAQKNLLSYLTSELEFSVSGMPISLKVSEEEVYSTPTKTVYGAEAWTQKLVNKFEALEPDPNNMFLSSIEPDVIGDTGMKTLRILSDKVNDEELLERIRQDFAEFARTNPELAADLFKYNLLANSMYYEKTSFSLIFPDNWAAAYSKALKDRLDTVIPIGKTLTQFNLEILRDDFLFQFVRNNSELISFPRGLKAKPTKHFKKYDKHNQKETPYYGGFLSGGAHFDLGLPASEKPQKFLRQYNSDVYLHIGEVDGIDYYSKIIEGVAHKFYNFKPHELENSLSFDKLTNLFKTAKVVNSVRIRNGKYYAEHVADELIPNSIVYAYDKGASHITTVKKYTVTSEGTPHTQGGLKTMVYTLKYLGDVDVTKKQEAQALRGRLGMFINEQLGTISTISDVMSIKDIVTKNPNYVLVTNAPVEGVPHFELSIPRWSERPSAEEIDRALKTLFKQIETLKSTSNYYFAENLLQPLDSFFSVKRKAADYLYKKTGYAVPNMEVQKDVEVTPEMRIVAAAIKRNFLSIPSSTSVEVRQSQTEPVHLIDTNSVPKYIKKAMRVGSILYLGESEGNGFYAVVREIGDQSIKITAFGADFFLDKIEMNEYPLNVFDSLYNEHLKNKC